MYSNHKRIAIVLFSLVSLVSYCLDLDFKNIVGESISIVSIALAVYAIAISSLVGSPLSQKLQFTPDVKLKGKTQLGVIKSYIKTAMAISILTLIISCIIKLLPNPSESIIKLLSELIRIIYSISFGLFALDFLFIWIVFVFVINRQIDRN